MGAPPQFPQPVVHRVPFKGQEIAVQDYPGKADAPVIVLLHGFPDNHMLYDRIVPLLSQQGHRIVTFDFIGFGDSSRPGAQGVGPYRYSHTACTEELGAVVAHLHLTSVVLVVHDASGPTGIDFAVQAMQPQSAVAVKGLLLLNTYYNWDTVFRKPEAILLFSNPFTRRVAGGVARKVPGFNHALFHWQTSRFYSDPALAKAWVAKFWASFPSQLDAFLGFVGELNAALTLRSTPEAAAAAATMSGELPVVIQFGASDPYLSPDTADKLKALLPGAQVLPLLPGAKHYPQLDQPEAVAETILGMMRKV